MNMRLTDIANQYERMVGEGAIKWLPVDKSNLPESTVKYVELFLGPSGLGYMVAEQRLGGTILFKIDHPTICYLHHDPVGESHMWADDGFHNALNNNSTLATLASLSGVNVSHESLMRLFDSLGEAH
jgi:hypothetical protein